MSKLNELMREQGLNLSAFAGDTKSAVATLVTIKKGKVTKQKRHKKPSPPR